MRDRQGGKGCLFRVVLAMTVRHPVCPPYPGFRPSVSSIRDSASRSRPGLTQMPGHPIHTVRYVLTPLSALTRPPALT
eukprot:358696-Chlamydomonas_euryale.AAC.1